MFSLLPLLLLSAAFPPQDLYDEDEVRDLRLTFQQSNWWSLLDQNRQAEIYLTADVDVEGVVYADVGVRFKGNSSASVWPAEKMPFKIKMDEFVAGQDLFGYDTINLGNSFMDPTFCREVVTYHYLRKYMPAPQANFVRLWLNGTYWGIYANTEQVSGEFLDEWFPDDDGNRYKCDPSGGPGGRNSTLKWLGSAESSYYPHYQLKSDPNGTEWADLVQLCDRLNNGSVSNVIGNVENDLNIDRAYWYLAGQNIFVNRDSYIESGHNYYVYNDPTEGRFHTIPWDSNEAFGNFGMGMTVNQLQTLPPLENYGRPDYPLLTRLLNPNTGPRGRIAYLAHYRELLEQFWNWAEIGAKITEYQTLIEADIIADSKRLYPLQYFYDNVTQDVTIGGGPGGGRTSCGLKPFVENREAYLRSLSDFSAPQPYFDDATVTPEKPTENDTLGLSAYIEAPGATIAGALLMWRAGNAGAYQEAEMFDDGQHGDGAAGDKVWAGVIPPQIRGAKISWYMLSWTTAENGKFHPWEAEEDPKYFSIDPAMEPNGIVINEFLAKNDNGIEDEAGQTEDWAEILNTTQNAVDLSGWYLSDDSSDLMKWVFPAGTQLGADETLLVWLDNDPADGPLHATFKLDANGEDLLLTDADGITLRDRMDFGDQRADVSTGRFLDGQEPWVTYLSPTPNQSNEISCGYRAYGPVDPELHRLVLTGVGTPTTPGGSVELSITGFAAGDAATLYASFAPAYREDLLTIGVVLIHPTRLVGTFPLTADITGTATLSVPLQNPNIVGLSVWAQVYAPTASLGPALSNAVEIVICP